MRNTLSALALTVVSASAMASGDILINAELVSGGKVVSSFKGSSISGAVTQFTAGTDHSYFGYVESESDVAGDVTEAKSATVFSGLKMDSSVVSLENGDLLVSFHAQDTELLRMDKFEVDGLQVQAPHIHIQGGGQQLILKSGKKREVWSYVNSKKQKVVLYITASKLTQKS